MQDRLQPRKPNPIWTARVLRAETHAYFVRHLRHTDPKLQMSSQRMMADQRDKANKEQRRLDWIAFYARYFA